MKNSVYHINKRILLYLVLILTFNTFVFSQTRTIEISTKSPEAKELFIEGRDLLENSANEAAEVKLDKALELDPDFLMAKIYKNILNGKTEDFNTYRDQIKKGKLNVTTGERIFIDYAESYIQKNVFEMEYAISQLIILYPEDPRIQNYYGITNYYSSKFQIAENYFTNAITIDENMAITYNMLGYTYLRQNKLKDAEEMFLKYISLRPELANPYDSYADFLLSQNRYNEAINYFEKSLNIRPAFWNSLNLLGYLYLNQKDYEKAKVYFEKITTIPETKENIYNAKFMLVYMDVLQDNVDNAIKSLEKIHNEAKKQDYKIGMARALAQKGFLLTEMKNKDEGYEYINKAIQVIEENKIRCLSPECSVWKIYQLSNNGNLNQAKIELDNMQDVIFEAQTLEAYNLWFTSEGYINYLQENYDKAVKSLKKGANNAFNWYHLGLILAKQGENEEAKNNLLKIVEDRELDIFKAVYYNKAKAKLSEL